MRAISCVSLGLLLLVTIHTSGRQLGSEEQLGSPEAADAQDESPPATAARASAQPRARAVILEIEIHGESAEPVPATVQATPVSLSTDEKEQFERLEVPVEIPGTSSLNFPTDGMWRVSLHADGFWSQELIVGPHPKGQIDMTVYPLVALKGRVLVEDGGTLPDDLTLRFQAVPSSPGSLREIEGSDQCPIDDEGTWECQAPAGNFDLRLGADGFVSHFFWERNLAEEKARAFGALSLQSGASFVATIQTEDDSPITGDCTATLIPQMMPAPDPVAESRTRNLRSSIRIGERGFVHFAGLTPGSYRMTVEQEGFATLTFEPILVRERQETDLQEPLVLKRPLTLRATLLPEVDLYARQWSVDLRSTGFFPKPIASGLADLQGLWQAAGLEPGSYSLTVSDSRGSRMAYEEFFLEDGRTELEIELLTVQVRGSVSLGDEPLYCQLSFGGRGPVAIRVETNLRGEYEAWLPKTGDWDIDVHAREPRVFRRLRKVPVEIDRGTRIATVDIELPETLIEGQVYEENGAPVEGATVLITRVPADERPSSGKTDEDGAFSIGGYPEGDYRLQASIKGEAGLRSSDTVQIEISESQPTATARLVIKDLVSLRGKVVSASGGVPGVTVKARPLAAGSELPGLLFPRIVTDATGAFTVNVPRTATAIDITVFPPGFLLARLRLPVDPSKELLVPVRQQSGGTLALQLEPSASSPRPETSVPFVILDGLLDLDFATLRTWALMNNTTPQESELTVPMLPPGNYSYCRRHRRARKDGTAGLGQPIQLCESGFLSPLGELRLDSPIGNDEDTRPSEERNQPAAN